MRLESKKLLEDVRQACELIRTFTADQTLDRYVSNAMMKSAVERQFEIIGEALRHLAAEDPAMISNIRDHRQIISFRNILIHGYDVIEDDVVWGVIQEKLSVLENQVESLLNETNQE
jgi:uncharacterized protein with HEPN domain